MPVLFAVRFAACLKIVRVVSGRASTCPSSSIRTPSPSRPSISLPMTFANRSMRPVTSVAERFQFSVENE